MVWRHAKAARGFAQEVFRNRFDIKSPPRPADLTVMWLSELSAEAWAVILVVIGCSVLLSLRTLADKLHYETTLHNLKLETRRMRQDHARRLEAPSPIPRRAAPAPAAIPVPTKVALEPAAPAPLKTAA